MFNNYEFINQVTNYYINGDYQNKKEKHMLSINFIWFFIVSFAIIITPISYWIYDKYLQEQNPLTVLFWLTLFCFIVIQMIFVSVYIPFEKEARFHLIKNKIIEEFQNVNYIEQSETKQDEPTYILVAQSLEYLHKHLKELDRENYDLNYIENIKINNVTQNQETSVFWKDLIHKRNQFVNLAIENYEYQKIINSELNKLICYLISKELSNNKNLNNGYSYDNNEKEHFQLNLNNDSETYSQQIIELLLLNKKKSNVLEYDIYALQVQAKLNLENYINNINAIKDIKNKNPEIIDSIISNNDIIFNQDNH